MDEFDTDDDDDDDDGDLNNMIEISHEFEVEDDRGTGGTMRSPHDQRGWRGAFKKKKDF